MRETVGFTIFVLLWLLAVGAVETAATNGTKSAYADSTRGCSSSDQNARDTHEMQSPSL